MIDILVLNYNDYETTNQFVEKVKQYKIINKILIVDNASTDDSYNELSQIVNDKIVLIKSQKNGGYGAGNNLGIDYLVQHSEADFILLSNPDVIIEEEAIKKTYEFMKSHPEYGLAAPFMCNPNHEKQYNSAFKIPKRMQYIFSFGLLFSKLFNVSFYKNLDKVKDAVVDVDGLSGSCFMMNKTVMHQYGMFDEKVFLYCEEIILSFKMKKANYKIGLLPNEYFIHNHSVSISKSFKTRVKRHKLLVKSKLYVIKHYYKANWFLYSIAWIIAKISIFETWLSALIKRNN